MNFGLTIEKVTALFKIADFKQVDEVFTLANEYWPDAYKETRAVNPWFLLKTPFGLIKIGPRKNVIELDWKHTALRKEPANICAHSPTTNVTKTETYVHCWSLEDVQNQLLWLRAELEAIEAKTALLKDLPLTQQFRTMLSKLRYDSKRLNHPLTGEQVGIAIPGELFREILSIDDEVFAREREQRGQLNTR